ncbi:unnamed protein product, partial [Linum tenue]
RRKPSRIQNPPSVIQSSHFLLASLIKQATAGASTIVAFPNF